MEFLRKVSEELPNSAASANSVHLYFACSLFVGCFLLIQYLSYRKLSHVPGPRLAAWSNLWIVGVLWRQQSHLEVYEVSKRYGIIARIGPNDLITTDIDLIHRMQAVRSPYSRSNWYRGFRLAPGIDNLMSTTDDKLHQKRRAQASPAFSGKGIEPIIDDHVKKFLSLIRSKYLSSKNETKVMDLATKVQYFALDAVMDIATGQPLEDLVNDKDMYDFLESSASSLPVIAMVAAVPWAGKLLQSRWIAPLVAPTASEYGIGKVIDIATKLVLDRVARKHEVDKPDMLDSFLAHGVAPQESIFELIITILGGSDTTSIGIRSTLLFIITDPRVYYTLQAEIDKFKDFNSNEIISNTAARSLPYLQAIIKEGLRILPPGTGQMPKVVPQEGEIIHGIFIPGGTNIGINPWYIMRDPVNFGADAEIFRPERWLEVEDQKRKEMEYAWELVWGYGKYKCLGHNIAIMEMGKVIFELMKNFDWEIVDPTKPWESKSVGIWIQKNLNVRVTERLGEIS